MSTPFVGEIRLFPYVRGAPNEWHICDGSLLPISQYDVLYTLLGTTYGGDGATTFGLPDLRGRVPIHQGTGTGLSTYTPGELTGTETVTLTQAQMPQHVHYVVASTAAGTAASPTGNVLAAAPEPFYGAAGEGTLYPLPATTVGLAGGNQPHDNIAPTVALNYCIALYGIFPSQS